MSETVETSTGSSFTPIVPNRLKEVEKELGDIWEKVPEIGEYRLKSKADAEYVHVAFITASVRELNVTYSVRFQIFSVIEFQQQKLNLSLLGYGNTKVLHDGRQVKRGRPAQNK